jgi:LPS-assembly protein
MTVRWKMQLCSRASISGSWVWTVLLLGCFMAVARIAPAHAQLSVPDTMSRKWQESSEPWKIEALKISYDRLQGIYEAEGEVRITSADRSIQSDWARLDSNNQEAELRGSVMIKYGQDWLKGEHAVWNLGSETGFLDGGLIYFSKNQFYVRGKTIAKTGQSQFELTDGMITSCDPANPDWSVRFNKMEVEIDGLARVKDTSFWVRNLPIFYSPVFALPANSGRHSGFLLPYGGGSTLNGFMVEVPYYWAIRPDMDATFYGQYLSKRGFMGGAEFRMVNETWGEAIGLLNYIHDQVDEQTLLENGYSFEGRERYWMRTRYSFHMPYEIEGRLNMDLASDRNYLNEFKSGSTSWDMTERIFLQHSAQGLMNDKNDPIRESVLYMNRRSDSTNLGLDVRYWENLDGALDEFTLQQLPKLSYGVVPTSLGETPFYYSLDSSWVDYWRPEWSRGQRLDLGPRVAYPLRLMPYLEIQPSVGVRATTYAVDWNGDPAADDRNSLQGRVLPDARLDLSSVMNRVYGVDFAQVKGVQHTIRPELTYEYIPNIDQDALPFFDPLDRIPGANAIRYGFSTYLTAKRMQPDSAGIPQSSYLESARLRVTQALKIDKDSSSIFSGGLIDDPLLRNLTGVVNDNRFSDVSLELDVTPARYVTFYYNAAFSPYNGSATNNDLYLILSSTRGDQLVFDYRQRDNPDISEIISAVSVKLLADITFSAYHDYSLVQNQLFRQIYQLTYQHGCWGLTVAYQEEDGDRQVAVSVNLLGLGRLGFGYGPSTGGMKLTQ